ncbi:MAG TPA: HoxN/HupN/NixA family nickel/cobalt transporter, partial [Chloroflexota bacterium]|nr:HoxN/HupN/NixA family nickel/cobalt transporter [Chloroflexota bacterium]
MLRNFVNVFKALPPDTRRRVVLLYAGLALLNAVAWLLALVASAHYSFFLASAVTAYTFGLRHAVDADHIAAIDNVTRKLMQDGKRPVGVGVFFSAGHSTIVVALSCLLALSIKVVRTNVNSGNLASNIGVIGTTVSAVFLLLIATINILVLVDIYKMWRQVSRGGSYEEQKVEDYLQHRGLLARLFRPVIRQVDASWKMYPVGVLFGLGFDTATEVGLLGIVATSGSTHLPVIFIMVFPLMFLAGMTVVDTTDSIMMLGAYGWAFVKPIRKLYYNLNITLISVLVALLIGMLEALQVVGQELSLGGPFWRFIANNISLNTMGFFIVAIFLVAWVIST